ncbi:MAG: hypothetical protein IJJ33_19010 [Victivallales bacterium]|nr:hypothetical protein [Victivallales bacterium]
MQNASEAITNLMASLENYYDAARNAMLVKKAVKKYGKTQSIVALIGQEGLAAAQTFSMEGFWEKVKNFLIKIWEKIKEWWGRFWGMFFSVEKKLESFVNDVKGKNLAHDCEYDGPAAESIKKVLSKYYDGAIKEIKAAVSATDMAAINTINGRLQGTYGDINGGINEINVAFNDVKRVFKTGDAVAKEGQLLLDVLKACTARKKDIDEYTKKAIEAIKKVTASNGDDNEVIDKTLNIIKKAAKLNNELVSKLSKAATTAAVKLMSHTRLASR